MELQSVEPSLVSVKAILLLDNDGKRVFSKYYDDTFPSLKEQQKFEETLFNKTHRANAEIVMLEGTTCVYRSNVDLYFYVVGSQIENELMLMSVLTALYDTVSQVLRRHVEKRSLFDHLDALMLIIDEIIDGGVVLETDPGVILQRIAIKFDDTSFSEQSVVQALQQAKDSLKWSLLK
ncbi:coatomer subunit zeta-1-like isoform X1 [Dysidea avara]|uniref:coatomer subunit zeta-1-like isoform X1 n=1 Tax=Dysidea avara TaxID=196820 RepID=UPI003330D358